MGAALVCAVLAVVCTYFLPILYSQDSVHYLSIAEHLARGDGYRSSVYLFPDLMQPPLYPLLIAAGVRLGMSPIVAAVGLCALAEAASLLVMVALYRASFGKRGSFVVALSAVVYANVAIGTGLLLEPLYCLLLALATWAATGQERTSPVAAVCCGLGVGLALVTRSEAVLTAGVLGLALLFWPGQKRRVLVCAVALVGAAAVVVPYGLWMRANLGAFELLPKLRYNVPFADITDHMDWRPDEASLTARDLRTHNSLMPSHDRFVLDYAFSHPEFDPRTLFPRRISEPGDRIGLLVRTAYRMLVDGIRQTGLMQPLVLLLLFGGVLRGVFRPEAIQPDEPDLVHRRSRTVTLCALVVVNLLPGLLSGENYQARFTAPALLFSVPLTVAGIDWWIAWIARKWPRVDSSAARVLVALALLVLYGSRTWRHLSEVGGGPRLEARAHATDEAMARAVPEGSSVLCEHARAAYLRHASSFQIPYALDRATLTDYIAHHHIEYALLDTRLLNKNPGTENRRLVDRAAWPPEWRLITELFPNDEPIWIVKLAP